VYVYIYTFVICQVVGKVKKRVCLSVTYLGNKHKNFTEFCLPVAVARSFCNGVAICYVLPVLWKTSCLPIIGQAK